MKSPFPGMDPYLESHWEDVHQTLAVYARDAIQPHLPDDLWARAEERVFLEMDSERVRHIVPDTHVSKIFTPPQMHPAMLKDGGLAAAEPLTFELHDLESTPISRRSWTRPTSPDVTTGSILASNLIRLSRLKTGLGPEKTLIHERPARKRLSNAQHCSVKVGL